MIIDDGTGMEIPPDEEDIDKNIPANLPKFEEAAKSSDTAVDVSEMMTMHATWLERRLTELKTGIDEVKNLMAEFLHEKIGK